MSSLRSARALPNDYWTAETVEDYMRCKVQHFSFLYAGDKICTSYTISLKPVYSQCELHIPWLQVINFPIGVQNPMARRGAFKTWILSRSVEEKVNFETIVKLLYDCKTFV